jgi:adenine deaminase
VQIATLSGASGRASSIGTIAAGKNADLVLIDGNPAANIADVENNEVVVKDGVGFDSQKIFDAMKGQVGRQLPMLRNVRAPASFEDGRSVTLRLQQPRKRLRPYVEADFIV